MNRLQISLKDRQMKYLQERARREGISMAEVLRRLIQCELDAETRAENTDSIWSLAGVAEDIRPLIGGIAVSERPEFYLFSPTPNDKEDHNE